MEILLTLLLVVNTIILIGIAGTLAKMVRYLSGDTGRKDQWEKIIRDRKSLDTQGRLPNYTETKSLSPLLDDDRPNWDGMPRGRNWDGIPQSQD